MTGCDIGIGKKRIHQPNVLYVNFDVAQIEWYTTLLNENNTF